MKEELHDPRTGFNDLKPLLAGESGVEWWAVVILMILVALVVARLIRRSNPPVATPESSRDLIAVIQEIRQDLRSGLRSVPLAASQLSQAVREWLEQRFEFNALELTRSELARTLEDRGLLPKEVSSAVVALVARCERIAFDGSDCSTIDDLLPVADSALQLLREVE